jgi:hypothetical protein
MIVLATPASLGLIRQARRSLHRVVVIAYCTTDSQSAHGAACSFDEAVCSVVRRDRPAKSRW